ncbi:hypothetical protein ISN44_As01g015120 [Arabidopsis suecica]|uniref:Uncharacterized protein n=1 Tax=Arabidopsis suecica TaxID=45249 RepID=A0A8T2H5K2_ARASU|nr:hypothetical protein ISN44_As01g015120 [Arabidopsis suecica]
MRNLINFAVLIMTIFIVSASGARETRMMEQTCPVFWPMVPCDANKCEQMCRDYYGAVPSYTMLMTQRLFQGDFKLNHFIFVY